MAKLLKIGGILALTALILIWPTAWALDRFAGRDVTIITPHAPEIVAVNQELWDEGDEVAEIYGVPSQETIRVLFADPTEILVPKENPTQVLLAVDKQAGENPLQARTVWFVAKRAGIGFGAVGVLALGTAGLLTRRRRGA